MPGARSLTGSGPVRFLAEASDELTPIPEGLPEGLIEVIAHVGGGFDISGRTRAIFDRYNIIDEQDLARAVAKRFNGQVAVKSETPMPAPAPLS